MSRSFKSATDPLQEIAVVRKKKGRFESSYMYPQHCFLAICVICAERNDMFTRKNLSGVFGSICKLFFKAEYIILVSICSILISPPLDAVRCRQWHGAYIYSKPLIFAQTYILTSNFVTFKKVQMFHRYTWATVLFIQKDSTCFVRHFNSLILPIVFKRNRV